MESAEIKKFDPKDYVQAIRERIRGAIVDVIPPAQWDEMVLAEMKNFMEDHQVRDGYNGVKIEPSGLKTAIRKMLEDDAKTRVKAMLQSPEWAGHWDSSGSGGRMVSEKVEALIKDNASQILSAWIGQAIQNVVSLLQSQAYR